MLDLVVVLMRVHIIMTIGTVCFVILVASQTILPG